MDYSTQHMRRLTFFLLYSSIVIWFLYFYFKLWEFIEAAISLKSLNFQTVPFIVYSFLLLLLPAAVIYSPTLRSKKIFMSICFSLSAVILVGAIGDLFTYKFFHNYTFVVGDAIFCNILVGIPNIYGTICCLVLSLLYFLFGKYITENRFVACVLYLLIILIEVLPALIYSFFVWGGFPRQAWIEKAAFIIPHQACLLISLILITITKVLIKKYSNEYN